MTEIPSLSDWLKAQPDLFEERRKFLFKDIYHKPTGEKVHEGFRYFHADADDLVAVFDGGDLSAAKNLPYALDDEGEIDTSALCLKLAYTKSGAFFAAQPEEYQSYSPVNLREAKYVEGSLELFEELDQSA
jgi:hypothetical protein